MAAEVSSVARVMRGIREEGEGKRELVTRDLLGGGDLMGDREVDLEMKVPSGWERQLDLMTGKTNLTPRRHLHLQDLNLLPASPLPNPSAADANRFPADSYTLDKVRSALERFAGAPRVRVSLPRSDGSPSPSSSSSITTSASAPPKRSRSPTTEMRAAACGTCLTYVLITAVDPRCPRCESHVPILLDQERKEEEEEKKKKKKKPRIDLNSASDEIA
ncbi:uncharacterized protein [Typha angustifolia]|uniref:uncharacterized protein n=1 Tax=Typha angustifolia TaxID=59011 RepID=UPI003C2D08B8